ncbi:hypothetical protein M404DRAFT_1002550 [Pisolithus tinctorius Marx 270]|uniref:Uncharacterized protein n=1 Tax=Pisolithus tinctorius Marx 270 TaxID=870435 RepID=A0A0C3IZ96_PISTI|nr:hypothetical protein M404DRAFT_1002550 [Pisolithus tinctorius Marx 270]
MLNKSDFDPLASRLEFTFVAISTSEAKYSSGCQSWYPSPTVRKLPIVARNLRTEQCLPMHKVRLVLEQVILTDQNVIRYLETSTVVGVKSTSGTSSYDPLESQGSHIYALYVYNCREDVSMAAVRLPQKWVMATDRATPGSTVDPTVAWEGITTTFSVLSVSSSGVDVMVPRSHSTKVKGIFSKVS